MKNRKPKIENGKKRRNNMNNINHGPNSVILHTFNNIKKIEQNHRKKVNKSTYKMSTKMKKKKRTFVKNKSEQKKKQKWH